MSALMEAIVIVLKCQADIETTKVLFSGYSVHLL